MTQMGRTLPRIFPVGLSSRKERFVVLCDLYRMDLKEYGLDDFIGCGPDEDDIPEFAAFEMSTDASGTPFAPWVYLADSLSELEKDLNQSETQREWVVAVDLNSMEQLEVAMIVTLTHPNPAKRELP